MGEGTFDSGASFSVTASDDVMLRGGQFSWRKTGTDQWNASVNAGAQAGTGNDVVFTVSASSLFGGNLTQNEHYDIRFLGTDWAGTVSYTHLLQCRVFGAVACKMATRPAIGPDGAFVVPASALRQQAARGLAGGAVRGLLKSCLAPSGHPSGNWGGPVL